MMDKPKPAMTSPWSQILKEGLTRCMSWQHRVSLKELLKGTEGSPGLNLSAVDMDYMASENYFDDFLEVFYTPEYPFPTGSAEP